MSAVRHIAVGRKVFIAFQDGEMRHRATCDRASDAARLLDRARVLNDQQRKYMAAARAIAEAEMLPGFHWVQP